MNKLEKTIKDILNSNDSTDKKVEALMQLHKFSGLSMTKMYVAQFFSNRIVELHDSVKQYFSKQ